MSKIVYTDDPNYIAPNDVIVLPLCEHPAYEDIKRIGKHEQSNRRIGERAKSVMENIKQKGYGTTKEIADDLGVSRQQIADTIYKYPEFFETVGKVGKSGNQKLYSLVNWE